MVVVLCSDDDNNNDKGASYLAELVLHAVAHEEDAHRVGDVLPRAEVLHDEEHGRHLVHQLPRRHILWFFVFFG